MDLSTSQIIVMVVGGGGIVGGVIAAINLIMSRLDKAEDRRKDEQDEAISERSDLKRIELDQNKAVIGSLWEIINEQKAQIASLKLESIKISERQQKEIDGCRRMRQRVGAAVRDGLKQVAVIRDLTKEGCEFDDLRSEALLLLDDLTRIEAILES